MGDEDSSGSEVDMAECGACRAVIPIDSKGCPECGVSFSGVADDEMGECGACGSLVPIDSKSCPQCGVHFVLDDLTTALSNWMKEETLTITELFGVVDVDNDGSLSAAEIKNALLDRDLTFLGSNELDRFLSQIDLNDDGVISFPELAAALSMPWSPPEEMTVLEPEDGDDAEGHVEVESDDEEDELRYTEHVLERVMKAHGITDKEAFLAHATSSDKDGNNFLREDELTEAAILWNVNTGSEDGGETDDENQVEDSDDDQEEDSVDDDGDDEESDDEESEDDDDDDEESEDDDDDDEESEDADDDDEESEDDDDDDEESEDDDDDDEESEDADDEDEDSEDDEDEEEESEDEDTTDEDWEQTESPEESKPEGPAEWQRFLMRNYENAFPIMYTIFAIFIGFWLVNAMGILVDGSGGPIAYDGDPISEISADTNWVEEVTLDTGDIYPCDKEIQESGCKNSLTPFSGVNGSSSMPAGFHWDGILFMVLGLVGLGGIAYLQMQIKSLRASHRRKKGDSADSESDSEENDSDEEEPKDSDDEEDVEDSDDEEDADGSDDDEEESDDEESDDGEEDGEESDDDDDEDSEDGIEIGSRVGVEDEDGDWYGEVIEFDDDEDAVVVKREDDGEEYVVDWDSLFQDD